MQCEDLSKILHGLRESILSKAKKIALVESSMLQFYYKQELHVEQPKESVKVGSTVAESGLTSSLSSPLPNYFRDSDITRALLQKEEVKQRIHKEYSIELRKVLELEEEVEKEVVQGPLAAKKAELIREQQQLRQLEQKLQESQNVNQQLQQNIHKEEELQLSLEKEKNTWVEKKRELEDRKRRQIENVDETREELCEMQRKLKRVRVEQEQRKLSIHHLKKLIAVRESQNKRRTQKMSGS